MLTKPPGTQGASRGAGDEAPIHRYASLDSTNIKAKELAMKGAPEGTIVLALTQSEGRGRISRRWHSPEGGLYFSIIVYPKDARRATELSILAGTALAQGTKEFLPKFVDVSVKWPNDLLINFKKVGGILCETTGVHGQIAVVIGIGINVNTPASELKAFQSQAFPASSIMEEVEKSQFDVEEVLKVVRRKFMTLYELYKKDGFAPIRYLWEKNCLMVGKRIELRESGWRESKASVGTGADVGVTVGTMLGIDEGGALVLANVKGERHQYVTGEITCFWP